MNKPFFSKDSRIQMLKLDYSSNEMKKVKLSEMEKESDLKCSGDALDFLKKGLDLSQENFVLIGLDVKNNIKLTKTLFKGGVNSTITDLKIIFKEVLINDCSRFIIGHNHPSGDLTPSNEDKNLTQKIKEGAKTLDLELLDHLIFDDKKFISFFDEDLL